MTSKYRKSQIKKLVHGFLWIGSTNVSFLPLKLSSIITICVLKLKMFGMPSILSSTGLKIIELTSIYWMNSSINLFYPGFLETELINAINKYNNLSTSDPDKLLWRHLKIIIKDSICLKKIVDIANTCFKLGHWPTNFKVLTSIVIPKPNKCCGNH